VDDHHLSNITKWKRRKHLGPQTSRTCACRIWLQIPSQEEWVGRLNGFNGCKIDFLILKMGLILFIFRVF
jgi:hypothetical protein